MSLHASLPFLKGSSAVWIDPSSQLTNSGYTEPSLFRDFLVENPYTGEINGLFALLQDF